MTDLLSINAVSPIDGRYHQKTSELSAYCSEFALIKYRVKIEIEYFIELSDLALQGFDDLNIDKEDLRKIYKDFSESDAQAVKLIEKTTNHDVKAVEYFVKQQLINLGLESNAEFVHFGLTSQDINNTAIPLSLKDCLHNIIIPVISEVRKKIEEKSTLWSKNKMIARTHGQPATPTSMGKEMQVFVERLDKQLLGLSDMEYEGKFGGASGNLNAHYITYPEVDWISFSNKFLQKIGLVRSQNTTQIAHYDNLAEIFHNLIRINTILIDFARDIWHYISIGYFKQIIIEGEIGSSAMPHKVNPIDFENAEGNFGIANALLAHLAEKLPVSRLQRDLTDSTVLRNIGVVLGHSLIAYKSIIKGISKIELHADALNIDLTNNYMVIAEAIQNILRMEGFSKPYEALKELTRGNKDITKDSFEKFIDKLDIRTDLKTRLKAITPENYSGMIDIK